ncbi:MAG: hypothetical protein FGM23_08005 [Alphaproteobacteria bacterium]|nr:hypothetical protein [Alphaproteobacteria bacterium]
MEKELKFELHLEGGRADGHSVPVGVLVQVLTNTQRAFELIGFGIEGREIKERARLPAETMRKFELACEIPVDGSYAVPMTAGNTSADFWAEQIGEALDKFTELLVAVSSRSTLEISKILPDSRLRKKVLEYIREMAPSPGTGWKLALYNSKKQKFATFDDGVPIFINELTISQQRREESQTITGELKSIDFSKRKLEIIYPPKNRVLDCYYEENIEDLLYENRREMIQVTGKVIVDDAGLPREIVNVTNIQDLDMTDFEIKHVKSDGIFLCANNNIVMTPFLDESKQLISLDNDHIGICVYAETREKLLEDLNAQIIMLWREYVLAPATDLSADAINLRHALLETFSEEDPDAA